MNYQDLLKEVDYTNPEDVVKCGLSFLQNDELVNEQKLYALGLLLNKNKEHYISGLRTRMEARCKDLDQLKSENAALKKQLLQQPKEVKEEPKKRVVIKVKKNV